MKKAVALLILFIGIVRTAVEESFFQSVPSDDYYRRNNVFDCVSRFYPPKPRELEVPDSAPAVAGGVRSFNGEYQHMVAIGWEFNGGIKYLCGGSIIQSRFILTAAHCSVPVNGVSPTTVRAGDTDLGNDDNDYLAQQRTIKRILRHPLHRHSRSYHDIALIELEQDLVFSIHISSACLWLEPYIPLEPLHIIGFGEVKLSEGPSLTLQKGHVSYKSKDACEQMLPSRRRIPDGLSEGQFCASHDVMDTCQGDSGGPIEIRRVDVSGAEIPLILGITSFGTACGMGSIGVYTNVTNYIDWIEKETNQSYGYNQCAARTLFTKFVNYDTEKINKNIPLPYVSLLRNRSNDFERGCMGTLIDDQFVVTSARCAIHETGSPTFIYIAANGEYVAIDEIIPHHQFAANSQANDIALIKLKKYLKRDLKPACLVDPEYSSMNGMISFMVNSLKTAEDYKDIVHFNRRFRPVLDQCPAPANEICMEKYFPVIPGMCQVTDGAPIFIESFDGIPLLLGIINAKNSTCEGKLRGTLIEPHKEWIKSILQRYIRREVLIFV